MNHKYKVGDKGSMRNCAAQYEVMLIDPSVEKSLIVKITLPNGRQYYTQYRLDGGALSSGAQDKWDLTPPKEYVWVNWYRDSNGDAWCVSHGQEEAATREYDNFAVPSTGIKRAVKTEVPC